MNANDIKEIFKDIDPDTVKLIAKDIKPLLSYAIVKVNKHLADNKLTIESLSPPPKYIMNSFRLCPINRTRMVIVGQDPYIRPGEANGCSFSTYGKKIPPSLREIYKCLQHTKLLDLIPQHGNLDNLAEQGVLLLNTALTTVLGKSYMHKDIWTEYTTELVKIITRERPNCVFVLLGDHAKKLAQYINPNLVFKWGHPSPQNMINKDSTNPLRFECCPVFMQINELFIARGEPPINYNRLIGTINNEVKNDLPNRIDNVAKYDIPADTLYIFTDGGARNNGKPNCIASWGYYIAANGMTEQSFDLVAPVDIPGQKFKSSNNRGELSAILFGLEKLQEIKTSPILSAVKTIKIISDSQYAINSVTKFYPSWLRDEEKLKEKMNIDLIKPIYDIIQTLQKTYTILIIHVNSHIKEDQIPPQGTQDWFLWNGNEIVDKLCQQAFADYDINKKNDNTNKKKQNKQFT